MLRYRLSDPGFELPTAMEPAQEHFDRELAETLDGMAERMEGNHLPQSSGLAGALRQLETTANACPNEGSPSLNDFAALCRTAERLASDVAGDLPTGTSRIGGDALADLIEPRRGAAS